MWFYSLYGYTWLYEQFTLHWIDSTSVPSRSASGSFLSNEICHLLWLWTSPSFSYLSNSSGIFSLVDWSMLSSLRPCSPPLCLFRLTSVYSSIVICELCGAATMFCHRAGRLTASYSSVWKGVICLVNCLSVWLQQPQHIQDQHLKKKGLRKPSPTSPPFRHCIIEALWVWSFVSVPNSPTGNTHTHTHTHSHRVDRAFVALSV